MDYEINAEKNSIHFLVDSDLYNLDIVYGAAYVFLDKAYIHLDGDPKDKIEVCFQAKEEKSSEELKEFAGKFLNELINVGFRYKISKQNRDLRKYFVGSALIGSLHNLDSEIRKRNEPEPKWEEDVEDIKIPWEKKNTPSEWGEDAENIKIPWEKKESPPKWEEDVEDIKIPWERKGNSQENEKPYKIDSDGMAAPLDDDD